MANVKTIEQHIKDQTYKVNRHGKRLMSVAITDLPEPSTDLHQDAVQYYYQFGHLLLENNAMTSFDLVALETLAERYSMYRKTSKKAADEGFINAEGMINKNVTISQQAFKDAMVMMKQFGLTPSSRTSINANTTAPEQIDDKLQAILKR